MISKNHLNRLTRMELFVKGNILFRLMMNAVIEVIWRLGAI